MEQQATHLLWELHCCHSFPVMERTAHPIDLGNTILFPVPIRQNRMPRFYWGNEMQDDPVKEL